MAEFSIVVDDESATEQFGVLLAKTLPSGSTVNLRGILGAGKTRLVQAVVVALGVDRELVTSPTYILCQHYEGTRPVHHLDAYRIKDEDEFFEIGGHELLESEALTFIEWGDRVAECLPEDRLEIEIEVLDSTQRRFRIVGFGPGMERVVEKIREIHNS